MGQVGGAAHAHGRGPASRDVRARPARVIDRRCGAVSAGVPLSKVLAFRDAYSDERQELARAVRKLVLSMSEPDDEADPMAVEQQIEKAVMRLERAGQSRGILWVQRGLCVFAGMGAAAAGAYAAPNYEWLFSALIVSASVSLPWSPGPGSQRISPTASASDRPFQPVPGRQPYLECRRWRCAIRRCPHGGMIGC